MKPPEDIYQQIFEHLSEPVIVVDRESARISDANTSARRLFIKTCTEIVGCEIRQIFSEKGNECWGNAKKSNVATVEVFRNEPIFLHVDAGGIFRISFTPITLQAREFIIILLTELSEVESREKKETENGGSAAGRFAHDLNNFIGLILGNVQLARQDIEKGHPAYESLSEIRDAALGARNLIEQIQSLSDSGATNREVVKSGKLIETELAKGEEVLAIGITEGKHILYVDDEAPLIFLYKRALERCGYSFTGITSADEALKAFQENPDLYDLVMIDINMPKISGIELARALKNIRKETRIALCSGHFTEKEIRDAKALGIENMLRKQNTVDASIEEIRKILSTPH